MGLHRADYHTATWSMLTEERVEGRPEMETKCTQEFIRQKRVLTIMRTGMF